MNDSSAQTADMLRMGSRAYAAHAAERLLAQHPECARQFGETAFSHWQDALSHRLQELAVALELDEPSLFAAQLQWSRDAFEARQVPVHHLRHSLEALREALRDDLPPGAADEPGRIVDAALRTLEQAPASRERLTADSDPSRLALRYVEAVLSGNRRRAMKLITDAVDAGLSLLDTYERVLLPAHAEIGVMWQLGELSIAEEHAATETTRTLMGMLSRHAPVVEDDTPAVLIAAVEGDRHDIGAHAVGDLLELAGFRVIALGSDVPVADIADAVEAFSPHVVILAASLSLHLQTLERSIRAVRATTRGSAAGIIVGGPAFGGAAHVAARLGADAYARSPGAAVEQVHAMTGR